MEEMFLRVVVAVAAQSPYFLDKKPKVKRPTESDGRWQDFRVEYLTHSPGERWTRESGCIFQWHINEIPFFSYVEQSGPRWCRPCTNCTVSQSHLLSHGFFLLHKYDCLCAETIRHAKLALLILDCQCVKIWQGQSNILILLHAAESTPKTDIQTFLFELYKILD